MNRPIMLIAMFVLLLQGCAKYVPVVDTKGKANLKHLMLQRSQMIFYIVHT